MLLIEALEARKFLKVYGILLGDELSNENGNETLKTKVKLGESIK